LRAFAAAQILGDPLTGRIVSVRPRALRLKDAAVKAHSTAAKARPWH